MTRQEYREEQLKAALRGNLEFTAKHGERIGYKTPNHAGYQTTYEVAGAGVTLTVDEDSINDTLTVVLGCELGSEEEKYREIAHRERHRDGYGDGDIDEEGCRYVADFGNVYASIDDIGKRLARRLVYRLGK